MDAALLKHIPLFGSLLPGELADMAASLQETCYPAGAVLFREGDYGDRFYIVLDGRIAIVKALGSDDERLLGLRGAGEFVGEMSLLSQDGLRTASVRIEVDARVLELTRADFDALLHRYPLLAYEMLRVLSIRLRESHDAAIRDLREKNARLAQAYADLQAAQARIIEQETLERELRLARETQESMLPRALPRLAGFDIGARMVAARMVGVLNDAGELGAAEKARRTVLGIRSRTLPDDDADLQTAREDLAETIFGQGDGSFEAWVFPVKIASRFRITAEMTGYPIPIELADYAAAIQVNPERTTLTYSHAAFTVKQHMFQDGARAPRVHLIGHSFGAKLVTSAVLAGVGTLIHRGTEYRVANGDVGPLTRALRTQLVAIQQGEAPDRHGWLERV
jgi:CRP-like cAMP-binding protein